MGAFIIILQVTLLLSNFGFTESSELLQCFNNYDTELKCRLKLSENDNCSEYKLTASAFMIPQVRWYTCHFVNKIPSCECTMQVHGFVPTEIFTISVLKGDKIWCTENITTEESIKPRSPIITSVAQKINGDFLITLNTTYKNEPFSKSLMVELTYGIDGSNDKVTTKLLEAGRTTYETVGRNLQPNSKYSLRARMKSSYPPNITFSDYSEPYGFKTSPSLPSLLKIIIPILCLILIICISSIYFWFDRILKPWWDEIPTPKFSKNFVKQVPSLLSYQTELSSVSLDSTPNHIAKKTCVESSCVQCEDNYYSVNQGNSMDSAPLLYSTPGNKSVYENSSENVRLELDKKHRYTNTQNEQSNAFSSEISNRLHLQFNSSSSSSFKEPVANIYPSEDFLVLAKTLYPTIQTDFEYSMWNGCTDSGNPKLIHITSPNSTVDVVFSYQSLDDQEALSSCNDPNIEEPFSTKKPQDVLFSGRESMVMPMEEEYQAFQSVA